MPKTRQRSWGPGRRLAGRKVAGTDRAAAGEVPRAGSAYGDTHTYPRATADVCGRLRLGMGA